MSQWFRSMVALAVLSPMLSGCFMARVTSRGTPGIHESETGFSLLWGIGIGGRCTASRRAS